MKQFFLVLVVVSLLFSASIADAALVSFINHASSGETIEGVDTLGVNFSSNDTTKCLLRTSLSLLNGTASISAYSNSYSWLFTNRGTRGLGILGQEEDEIDSYHSFERIEVNFINPVYLKSFEVRSLFYEPNLFNPGIEHGEVGFYLNNSNVFTQHMTGVEDIRQGTKGIVNYTYSNMWLIDKLVYYVPQGMCYTPYSEFALAKFEVEEVPEPATICMLLSLGAGLFTVKGRKKIIV